MKPVIGISNEGVVLRVGGQRVRLVPDSAASQTSPRGSYVYGHYDEQGVPFYIGKGTSRRAWNDSRHPLWHRYVDKHLNGKYVVKILADGLSDDEVEDLESQWIAQESDTLVNWINFGRKTDFTLLDRVNLLRDANRNLISRARSLEKTRPDEAIALYHQAIEKIEGYAAVQPEQGLIGMLLDEERAECGIQGELVALDRLTLLLVRAGKHLEAGAAADDYFAKYRADEDLQSALAIKKRVARKPRGEGNGSA